MKFVIAGGSGQVGRDLSKRFTADGHEVVILSRNQNPGAVRHVCWDGVNQGDWVSEVDGADVIINLAGRSVNCRYTPKNRRLITDSRVDSVKAIGEAIRAAKNPPPVWLQASTATIYCHRFDAPNDDETGVLGGSEPNAPDTWRFSIDVAKAWEAASDVEETPNTRKALLRSSMIMAPDSGGIFDTLLNLTKFGLGGASGSGKQYISWIHHHDFQEALYWLIEHSEIAGPINVASPNPLPNSQFMKELRLAWGIPIGLPATDWMLEIGAVALGTETELILKSRRVVPSRLVGSGFKFKWPNWPEAAADLCSEVRARK